MIGPYIPDNIETFYEPFCGSGAMSIYAAYQRLADQFVLGDTLEPIVSLMRNHNNHTRVIFRLQMHAHGALNRPMKYQTFARVDVDPDSAVTKMLDHGTQVRIAVVIAFRMNGGYAPCNAMTILSWSRHWRSLIV